MSSFNEYLQQRFEGSEGTEELQDIANHGLAGGVTSFIYTHELDSLYHTYEEDILDICEASGVEFPELAANCVNLSDLAQNAVWMAVEMWALVELTNRENKIALAA